MRTFSSMQRTKLGKMMSIILTTCQWVVLAQETNFITSWRQYECRWSGTEMCTAL